MKNWPSDKANYICETTLHLIKVYVYIRVLIVYINGITLLEVHIVITLTCTLATGLRCKAVVRK